MENPAFRPPCGNQNMRAKASASAALSGRGKVPNRFADVAQLVERELPKLEVAGSRPVVRF